MDLYSLLIPTELSQSDNEQLDIRDCYETSDDYETTDDDKYTKNKEFQDLKNFFSVSNPQDKLSYNKRYLCSGLCEEKHLKYIKRVGSFIIFGRASPIYKVAQELFPLKFTNETKFSYSKLSSDQSRRLNDELSARSKMEN
ncbi:17037_t:CDS:2 [Gigaspora margarita]|uniref:17037_t:CDS:1 n=1 Tax=Gigaspora margarita TaxID=4874 RepID=A0ABN7VEC6_GIGMA|nr:17037_t:CDS:2 [Gigaspora margarita]